MPPKETEMPASHRGLRSKRASVALVVVIAAALVAATASLALARGPVYAFLAKASKPHTTSGSAARKGSLSKASRVTRTRTTSKGHGTGAVPAPTPQPSPSPAPPVQEAPPLDTAAPETSITSAPALITTSTNASFAFAASESGASFECRLDGSEWKSCAAPKSYSGLGLGLHEFSVRATDVAGNVDQSPAISTWTVLSLAPTDTTAPETSISSGPSGTTTATSASFSFSASESGSSFECRLDSGSWTSCSSPQAYSGLAVGAHQFSVRATDVADNTDTSPATRSWTVEAVAPPPPPADTTAPETTVSSGPSGTTTATGASLGFSASESGSTFECKLDSGSWASCGSPKSYTGLNVGSHQFSVRATDTAGNTDASPATRGWTVEAPAPPPPPTSDECTSTVSTVSAAQSSVSSAAPGAVVCLADGSYGKVTLNATKAAPGVTLRAQSPGKATIAGASLSGARLTIASFVSTDSIVVQPGATGMTIEHNRVTGGGQGLDIGPTSTTTINDTKVIGNKLIGPFGEDAIHLNRYHDSDGDGIGILIEGNEITGVRENGNHSDCLQTVWVGDHIVFRKNYLHDNRCQGFFVKDQASLGGVSGPINGITVEDNLFIRNKEPCGAPLTSCGQPMYFQVFGPYSGFTMRRNTIWGDGMDSVAAFRESTGADTQIANNVIYRLWTDANMSSAKLNSNTICKREAGSGGSWETTRSGETTACSLSFQNTAADDYRLAGSDRGVDWAPAEQHFGP
jgi:hypothetical protein